MKKEKNKHAVAMGSIKTLKKAISSRLNGLKGGRPKKALSLNPEPLAVEIDPSKTKGGK